MIMRSLPITKRTKENAFIGLAHRYKQRNNARGVTIMSNCNLVIPEDLKTQARKYGINISFVARKALEREIALRKDDDAIEVSGKDTAGRDTSYEVH